MIEPYTSTFGHLYVTGATSQINAVNIRIEAAQQPNTIPMIYFGPETYHSKVSGLFSAGWIDANRLSHQLDISAGQFVGASYSHNNMFSNSAFRGIPTSPMEYDSSFFQGWTLTTTPPDLPTVYVDNTMQILADHNVLHLTIKPGTKVTLKSLSSLNVGDFSMYRSVSFGMYVRYVNMDHFPSSSVYATYDTSITGVTTSLVHPGANAEWLFLSMVGNIPIVPSGTTVDIYPYFVFHNTNNTYCLDLEISLPSLTFGAEPPQVESGPLLTSGGQMHGTLSTSLVKNIDISSGSNFYTLPKDGNVFLFKPLESASYPTILRLNHLSEDRFPQGTVITLLFLVENVSISSSVYIALKSGFTSSSHCSIVLLSMGDGTWVEVSRDI